MTVKLLDYQYKSSLSILIDSLVKEKRASGYIYNNEARIFKNLDEYWFKYSYPAELTLENLDGWLRKRPTEGNKSLSNRITAVRVLAVHMLSLGRIAVIPENKVRIEKPMIHVLNSAEIEDLFERLDEPVDFKRKNQRHLRLHDSCRVELRLILCLGLRNGEACSLKTENFDYEKRTLKILDAKNEKQRVVFLTQELADMLVNHIKYIANTYGCTSDWLFPGYDTRSPITVHTVEKHFNRAWNKTSFADKVDKKPTVHSLRHTFVMLRIRMWEEEGKDVNKLLPYLTKHLGHSTLDETYYYYQRIQESLETIRRKDNLTDSVIPEVYGL